jgi:hypothetical protein
VEQFNVLEKAWYHLNPTGKPWFGGYVIGYESLIINALIVIFGLGVIYGVQQRRKG